MSQRTHWSETYDANPDFFGEGPSELALGALERFRREGVETVLELGCGQGRDTLLFARAGLRVTALDYSETAVRTVDAEARDDELSSLVVARVHDLREPLPFADASFDACFAHMLLCMELTTAEVAFVLGEVRRVLKPGGLAVYSVRSTLDKHFGSGRRLGDELWDVGGFVVHFFSEEELRALAAGWEVVDLSRMEEGRLPRDLFA
ncbi:MAG: methyltransferase domain-containing protein, partial [Deltaproteobacteria bacterium]|nr:methyltransferase domain-containing protein [Deltaproteobacteria bacterium]